MGNLRRLFAAGVLGLSLAAAAQQQPTGIAPPPRAEAGSQRRRASLREALQLAAKQGPDVAAARAQAAVVGSGVQRAWTSWQPDLSVTGTYDHTSAPSVVHSMSPRLRATSSDRRNAPENPSNRMARSRSSRSEVPLPPTIPSTMSLVAAFLRTAAAPIVRRIPDKTALTFSSPVGASSPAKFEPFTYASYMAWYQDQNYARDSADGVRIQAY